MNDLYSLTDYESLDLGKAYSKKEILKQMLMAWFQCH